MNRWKIAFFSTVALLVISNAYWAFTIVDSAISYSYLYDSYDEQVRKIDSLGDLIIEGTPRHTKADIIHLLRQADADGFIVEEEDTVLYKNLSFIFVENQLVDVQ